MVPASIKSNLAGLRRRERALTFVWGAACWFAISLVLLILCCFVDWLIDRQRETPMGIRLGMFFVQLGVAGLSGLLFILWPQIKRLPDHKLALWVEDKMPQFDHRLISAVQLNQPDADTEGMSQELVGVVTREAEKLTKRTGGFPQVADHWRLVWTVCIAAPVVFIFLVPFVIRPSVYLALLGRQFLLPIDIPHYVNLESVSPAVWPIGEEIPLQFRVRGEYDKQMVKQMVGTVYVTAEGDWLAQDYPIEHVGPAPDGDGEIFGTYIPASSANITYWARLADGRTKYGSQMRLVPLPVVSGDAAWVRLPAFCGLRLAIPGRNEEDRRYEEIQESGKIEGIPGSTVRVQFDVDSLNHKAYLVLYAPDHLDPARNDEENRVLEKERLTLQMQVRSVKKAVPGRDGLPAFVDAIIAERIFALTDKYTGFKLIVEDDNRNAPTDPGFKNVNPPRWSLKQIAEPAPRVSLLRDSFGSDDVFESPPVPIGEHIRIPYECSNKYGLGRAEVLYRLLKKHESGEMPAEDEDWISLRLPDIPTPTASGDIESVEGIEGKATIVTTKNRHNIGAGNVSISDVVGFPEVNGDFENKVLGPSRFTLTRSKKAGKGTGGTWFWAAAFDSKTGVFLHTDDDTPVEFHAVPSPNPEAILGRTFGGGRHHLSTTGLLDKKTGKAVQLKSGDLIEYCVKVYAPARQPEASTPFAVSGTRVTEVRTRDEVGEWYEKVAKENAKVRELYNRQLEVRAPK